MRTINDIGISLIKKFEGCRLRPYRCSANVLTIGYGNTSLLRENPTIQEITQEKADELLKQDLELFCKGVCKYTKGTLLTDNQFAALVSFSFNLGLGTFQRSSLRRYVNEDPNQLPKTIRYCFEKYKFVNKKINRGIEKRRKEEADLYFTA